MNLNQVLMSSIQLAIKFEPIKVLIKLTIKTYLIHFEKQQVKQLLLIMILTKNHFKLRVFKLEL